VWPPFLVLDVLINKDAMLLRCYMDTSVFYGAFRLDVGLHSLMLLDMVLKGQILVLYSDVTEKELRRASDHRPQKLFDLLSVECKKKTIMTPEVKRLAKAYIDDGVVGKTSMNDCMHIAAATVYRADMLVSWNFKHIVNIQRIKGYNDINVKFEYPILEIRNPTEVLEHGYMGSG
jgi:predicted nucleic acid-binding protein